MNSHGDASLPRSMGISMRTGPWAANAFLSNGRRAEGESARWASTPNDSASFDEIGVLQIGAHDAAAETELLIAAHIPEGVVVEHERDKIDLFLHGGGEFLR